jgi:hypothetical protein
VCGAAATALALDAMLVGSTAPALHASSRSARAAAQRAAVGYEHALNALRGKQRSERRRERSGDDAARGDGDETRAICSQRL